MPTLEEVIEQLPDGWTYTIHGGTKWVAIFNPKTEEIEQALFTDNPTDALLELIDKHKNRQDNF